MWFGIESNSPQNSYFLSKLREFYQDVLLYNSRGTISTGADAEIIRDH